MTVACAYAVTVDGFIAIAPKAIRNRASPMIVWMSQQAWVALANCATPLGQFYIPCVEGRNTTEQLRKLVEDMENGNG